MKTVTLIQKLTDTRLIVRFSIIYGFTTHSRHNQQGLFRRLVNYFSEAFEKKISVQVVLDKKKTELLKRKRTSSDAYYLVDI